MQPLKQGHSTSADRPGLLAPDTTGMNFYRADPALTDLLRLHLPDVLFRHIEPHLDRLGALAGGHLDECARLAVRHPPVLHQRDRFGRDTQHIEYHPAYRELEKAAFGEFGIHAMSVRKGILGWPDKYPVVAKHAFTFLFNQAEFGLGCPINVTDGCAKLLNNFGSDELTISAICTKPRSSLPTAYAIAPSSLISPDAIERVPSLSFSRTIR